jgi:hypothetical protein
MAIISRVTENTATFSFASVHLGEGNVIGAIRRFEEEDLFEALREEISSAFRNADYPELIRTIDRRFQKQQYTLRVLFRDEQRRISGMILEAAMSEVGTLYRSFYGQYGALARLFTMLGIPIPIRFQKAVEFALNEDLLHALTEGTPDPQRVSELLKQVRDTGTPLDTVSLEFRFRKALERIAADLGEHPEDLEALKRFDEAASVRTILPFEVDAWALQNLFFSAVNGVIEKAQFRAGSGDEDAIEWINISQKLGEKLGFSSSFLSRG